MQFELQPHHKTCAPLASCFATGDIQTVFPDLQNNSQQHTRIFDWTLQTTENQLQSLNKASPEKLDN